MDARNLVFIFMLFASNCIEVQASDSSFITLDPSSFSRPELSVIRHISLTLNVNFEKKILSGETAMEFDVLKPITEVVLDTSNLTIDSIYYDNGQQLAYKMDEEIPIFGTKLTITLPNQLMSGDKFKLRIQYSTSPNASGLHWLNPIQTSEKKHPYLFSNSVPIHARSILPCQDTPAVKFTYSADVTAPASCTVLMSALRAEPQGNLTRFYQPLPLPAYLVAIAVGVLESRRLGPRSKVWCEREDMERAASEFADTERLLSAAERLYGTYEWGQYDLLVLPPSFPYGGMENPCLTFVTPTLLAGDKSQADVIIHEIVHSWTGNSVSIKNFEHFWLKEGFTVFIERKVAASLISNPLEANKNRDFHSILGLLMLNETIRDQLGANNQLTKLVVDLKGVNPNDAINNVPYEKGSLFLRYLEDLLGGPEVFDNFIRAYLRKFRHQSLDTEQFQSFLLQHFAGDARLQSVDWQTWFHGTGMPPLIPEYDTSMTKAVQSVTERIQSEGAVPAEVGGLSAHQRVYLLQALVDGAPLPLATLRLLGQALALPHTMNSELQYRWLRLCVRSRDEEALPAVFQFLNRVGRMKFVRPLYRDLYAWEPVRQRAVDNFLAHESSMMHVTAYTLRKDLHLD